MINLKKYRALFIAAVAVSSVFIGGITFGTDLSQSQRDAIVANCYSTKNTLNQLHASDALLRVNMGQMYEAISTKLMDGLNRRVANNNFNNSYLKDVSNSYNSQLDSFRADYIVYEDDLSSAIRVDCKNNPTLFYDSVASARNNRNKVHDDVVKLNKLLNEYGVQVDQFIKYYQDTTGRGD